MFEEEKQHNDPFNIKRPHESSEEQYSEKHFYPMLPIRKESFTESNFNLNLGLRDPYQEHEIDFILKALSIVPESSPSLVQYRNKQLFSYLQS